MTIVFHFSIKVDAQTSMEQPRPRIVVTADPELDDNNSLIRFLLYSTDMEIEGLIYASSQYHWKGDGKGTKWYVPGREYDLFGMNTCPCESWRWAEDERFIHDIVEAYEQVYPNLKQHHPNYPTPDYLKSKIRFGNIEFDGDFSKDTPGSNLIKSLILDDEPGSLFITAWGGQSTIARSLKSIQDQYEYTTEWESIKSKVSRKVILLPNGDQDDTYAIYIKPNWPDIEYRQFTGGPRYGYGAPINASVENAKFLTSAWMKENVLDRGPLGDLYRVWGDGKQMVEGDKVDYFGLSGYTDEELKKMGYFVWMPVQAKGSWLSEGDNVTFMNMLGNGLRGYEKGFYGGWGGRVSETQNDPNNFPSTSSLNADEMAASIGAQNNQQADKEYPNFFPQVQRDFANRLKWSVTEKYSDANHEPKISILGPLHLLASPGQKIQLHGSVSDPDGDNLSAKWWQFQVGSYPGKVEILNPDSLQAEVLIPEDAVGGQTIHIIFEATDDGTPSLTRYKRVIVTVKNE
ncbi:MAG: nucleoside hydrolase-like domain-containing protein [Bacteroidota bacterium]